MVDISTGVVVTERCAHSPSLYTDLIVRGRTPEQVDLTLASADNTYIVTQSNAKKSEDTLLYMGEEASSFVRKYTTTPRTLKNNILSYDSPTYVLRNSARNIHRAQNYILNTADVTKLSTPRVRSEKDAVVIPQTSFVEVQIPSNCETISIYNRSKPSITSQVHEAKVMFPRVGNQSYVERASAEKDITTNSVKADAAKFLKQYSR